ncbi:MAG: 4Fe-4S binding protein [Planctomycetota bacterium]
MATTSEASPRRGRLRLAVRCAALVAAVILVLPVLAWPQAPLIVPALSPHVLVCSAIAARAVGTATLIGLPVLVVVVFRRRWFCRYGCPVGLLTEYAGRIGGVFRGGAAKVPSVGRWIVLLTLGGALLGYPLFLWLDPLAVFHGSFTLLDDPLSAAGRAAALVLAAILITSLIVPGLWCLRICPLGAAQELATLARGAVCLRRAAPAGERAGRLSRRSLFSTACGAVCVALGARWAAAALGRSEGRPRRLRPPGSVEEACFPGMCIRCGNCARACPAGIIGADDAGTSVAGLLAPVVRFEDDYCREDCRLCTQVCPSGALRPLSLDEKQHTPMGLAKVDPSLCLLTDDRECDACARACPFEAIRIVWSEEEYVPLPHVEREKCPGCGACEVICPGTNEWERERASEGVIALRKAIEVHPPSSA